MADKQGSMQRPARPLMDFGNKAPNSTGETTYATGYTGFPLSGTLNPAAELMLGLSRATRDKLSAPTGGFGSASGKVPGVIEPTSLP